MNRILVLDCDASMRALVTEWLESAGYAVEQATCSESAVAQLNAQPFAAIITEIAMPKWGSGPVVTRLRSMYPDIPVIATCTRYCGDRSKASLAARELGVEELLAKPFSREDLLKSVASISGVQPKP